MNTNIRPPRILTASSRSAFFFSGSSAGSAFAQSGGELRFCLRSEPKTFDPLAGR